MKNIILFIACFVSLCSFGNNKKHGIDILSYNVEMHLDTISRKLDIHTDIRIQNTDTTDIVRFLFCDWIKINKAQLNDKSLEYRQGKDTLLIHVDRLRKLNLILDYTLPVDSFKQDKPGKVIALTRAMKWCPFIYDDISELNSKITVPKGYKVYSSGVLLNYNETATSCHYRFQNKINSGFPCFFAPTGYFRETAKTQNGINVKFYFHNPDSTLINPIIKESLLGLDFSTQYIGKYNRPNLTYIELPGFDSSQSLESFVLMGSNFIKYFGLYPDIRFWPTHETIHQWVGAGYFNTISKNTKNRWFIEESLTEYLRYVYVEKTYGTDSLKIEIKKSIDYYNKQIKGTSQDVSISANLPNDITYCIGPLIFHTVRMEMGDENWHKFIQKLYANNYGNVIDYNMFKKLLSKYAGYSIIQKMEDRMNTKGVPKEFCNY